jgi:hypothetical protein
VRATSRKQGRIAEKCNTEKEIGAGGEVAVGSFVFQLWLIKEGRFAALAPLPSFLSRRIRDGHVTINLIRLAVPFADV